MKKKRKFQGQVRAGMCSIMNLLDVSEKVR
jgi:hypothetical protein